MNAFLPGHPLRAAHVGEVLGIHGHRDPNVGAGNRREHRALFGREWRPAQSLVNERRDDHAQGRSGWDFGFVWV